MLFLLILSLINYINSSKILNEETDFMIVGFSTNMSGVYVSDTKCNYQSCQQIICNVLANTTSSYVLMYTYIKVKSCPKLSGQLKVNMINFILDDKFIMHMPSVCHYMSDCIMMACDSFKLTTRALSMTFTGECL